MRYSLFIPRWHPTPLNRLLGCHWGRSARLKRVDREVVGWYVRLTWIPKAVVKRRVQLHLVLAPRKRAADVDAHQKSLLDALVQAEMLVDDSRVWCEIVPTTYERGTVETWGARLVLEDMEGGDGTSARGEAG